MDAMTWTDYALARALLSEERIGTKVRDAQRREDEQFRQSTRALEKRR